MGSFKLLRGSYAWFISTEWIWRDNLSGTSFYHVFFELKGLNLKGNFCDMASFRLLYTLFRIYICGSLILMSQVNEHWIGKKVTEKINDKTEYCNQTMVWLTKIKNMSYICWSLDFYGILSYAEERNKRKESSLVY